MGGRPMMPGVNLGDKSVNKYVNLIGYLDRVYNLVSTAIAGSSFHHEQQELLQKVVSEPHGSAKREPLGDPLSTIYLIATAHERRMDRQAAHVGAFCLLYILSLDLFDDVQDEDLAATPHAEVSPAIAINNAIALGFLALDQLRLAITLEDDPQRRLRYLELNCRISLTAVAGQHRDLMGTALAPTPEQVLQIHQAKTSSLTLLTEAGALLGRCDTQAQMGYRTMGEQVAKFIQIRDDVRDIFGKNVSPDLSTGKVNYPIACFYEAADANQREHFHRLVQQLPESMPALRTLLYEAGAVERSATALEQCRETIHQQVAVLGQQPAPLRLLLDIVDSLAESVYQPPRIDSSRHLWKPRGIWHQRVRAELDRFCERTRSLGLPAPPQLRPWHLPQWMYVPEKRTIFYPDIEGLPREVLPYQAQLLGIDDLDEVARVMHEQIPMVVAHEMFHFWRDAVGRLSRDHWHEEWAANRLAVAYARSYAPEVLNRSLSLAERVLTLHGGVPSPAAETVLKRCARYDENASGYRMSMLEIALTALEMIKRLAAERPEVDAEVDALLSERPGTMSRSA